MKKLIGLTIFLLLIAGIVTAQAPDSTAVHGSTPALSELLAWLKTQWVEHKGTIILLVFAAFSEWLGNTGKVKEGSVIAWVLNLIGKILKKKADIVQTKKGKFMSEIQFMKASGIKALIFLLMLSGIGLTASAQKAHPLRWYPFNKTDNMDKLLKSTEPVYSKDSTFYFAPAVSFDVYTRGMSTGNHSVGAIPGIGYNLVYKPANWKTNYLAAIGIFASAEQDKTNPDVFTFEVTPVLSLLNWIKLGYGYQWNFGGKNEWVLRLGIIKSL
jgi:hypothetical protein